MADKPETADYAESLQILTKLARGGDVRASIALASHLRDDLLAYLEELQEELRRPRVA
jgi:hypothetical protein